MRLVVGLVGLAAALVGGWRFVDVANGPDLPSHPAPPPPPRPAREAPAPRSGGVDLNDEEQPPPDRWGGSFIEDADPSLERARRLLPPGAIAAVGLVLLGAAVWPARRKTGPRPVA